MRPTKAVSGQKCQHCQAAFHKAKPLMRCGQMSAKPSKAGSSRKMPRLKPRLPIRLLKSQCEAGLRTRARTSCPAARVDTCSDTRQPAAQGRAASLAYEDRESEGIGFVNPDR